MRVLYVLGSLNIGGAEKLVYEVLKNSKGGNVQFSLLHRKKGSLLSDFENLNLPIYFLNLRNLFKFIFKFRSIIKNNKISIVHTHQVIDTFFTFLFLIGIPTKIVFTIHSHGVNDGYIQRVLRKYILNKIDVCIYVSISLRNFYANNFNISKKRHEVVYNGLSFSDFKPILNSKCLEIGMVGNFTSVRDQMTICKFLDLLDKEGINFKFYFVGAKSDSEYWLYDNCFLFCDHLIKKDKVFFMGSRNDVPLILSKLDCFIYSSQRDTFGMAVVEAMAMGIPTFVNDSEVMCEITNNGKWATIYKSKDEYDLLNKFNYFLKNVDAFKSAAQENAFKVKNTYSIDKHTSILNDIYNSLK